MGTALTNLSFCRNVNYVTSKNVSKFIKLLIFSSGVGVYNIRLIFVRSNLNWCLKMFYLIIVKLLK